MSQGRVRTAARVAGPPVFAAVLGNAFIGKEAMTWFRGLNRPRLQVPLPVFVGVGALFYLAMGVVLRRADQLDDPALRREALVVLAGNEAWNVLLFGRRSPGLAVFGMLAFLVPVMRLRATAAHDRTARLAAGTYAAWVLLYDVPWSLALWRCNRRPKT